MAWKGVRLISSGGPMLVFTCALEKYLPLILSGFFFAIASMSAFKFSSSAEFSNVLSPILPMMKEPSLMRNSTRPYFDSLTASRSSCCLTSVPLLVLGMRPFGPSTRAIDLSWVICSGVAIILSKLITPSLMSLRTASSPIKSAPCAYRSSWNSVPANTHTFTSFPVP